MGAPDVCPVLFAARILDVAADRLQRDPERSEVRVAQMGVFDYVCYCHRHLTTIQASWPAGLLAGRRTCWGDSSRATSVSLPFLVVCLRRPRCVHSRGSSTGEAEFGGQSAEQNVESPVKFGEPVVEGHHRSEFT